MLSRRRLIATLGATVACPAILRAAPLQLRLAHSLPTSHPVHPAMQFFADAVSAKSAGALQITLFADGQLGQEADLLSLVQAGKLDLLKVSASLLERYSPAFKILNLPYSIRDREHWRRLGVSEVGKSILDSTRSAGLHGLTYYNAGFRSFYGRKPISHPDDLKGMKIRIQPSETMAELVSAFGGEPVELAWSNVYIGLKSGLVDGAENSVAALIIGNHADVVTHYSYNEHTNIPDVLLIGSERFDALSANHRAIVEESAWLSHHHMNDLWDAFEAESRSQVTHRGVMFVRPDKGPFIEKAAAVLQRFVSDDPAHHMLDRIAKC